MSLSASVSPSVSESPSISASISPSESISPSPSVSPSASISLSISPSLSVSPSESISPSASVSPSIAIRWWNYIIFDSFDTIPQLNVSTKAFVDGQVAGATSTDIFTNAYIDCIDAGIINTKAFIHGTSYSEITTDAYIFGTERSSCFINAYVDALGVASISIKSFIDGCLNVQTSINAFIYPWNSGHAISIPAFLNAEDFIDPDGNAGFSNMYNNNIVLTDLAYNRVTTLMCDYHISLGILPIVFNLFLVNGKRYKVSNVKFMTNSTWSTSVSITHGLNTQYLTDSHNTTAILLGPFDVDTATNVTITVTEAGVSSLTTIPIYISYEA